MVAFMMDREVAYHPEPYYMERQQHIDAAMRSILLAWMMEVRLREGCELCLRTALARCSLICWRLFASAAVCPYSAAVTPRLRCANTTRSPLSAVPPSSRRGG